MEVLSTKPLLGDWSSGGTLEVSPTQGAEFVEDSSDVFETVRIETDAHPPLVELGRTLLAKAQDGDTEGVRELMKNGAPFTTDWLGTSAIHWACQLNHYDTAELLLKAGISRDARNKVDRTPLHVTAQEGHVRILKLLLDHGVDVDATDMLQMTPLHWAAEYGHEECVRLLLEHGADPEAINKFDKTADQIAFDNNRLDITHMIQEYAENPLRDARRKAAKEKQKQAAAAHKLALEQEKARRTPPKSMGEVEKVVKMMKLKRNNAVSKISFDKVEHAFGEQPTQPETEQTEENNTEKTLAMLQAHGITMLPNDDSTIVESAVQSGQKIVLTEAGKMALTLTETPTVTTGPIKVPIIKLPEILKGKRVITIRADQLINMKKQQKVIIQTDKNISPAPVGIKTVADYNHAVTNPRGRPKGLFKGQRIKTPVEVLVTKKTVNNETKLTASYVQKPEDQILEAPEVKRLRLTLEDTRKQLEKSRSEVRLLKVQEEEVKSENQELKNKLKLLKENYLKKEREANEYKKMVEILRKNN